MERKKNQLWMKSTVISNMMNTSKGARGNYLEQVPSVLGEVGDRLRS